MTTYIAYLLKFLFRIKWWLILCPTLVAVLVYFYMGRTPRTYKSSTTIYTGVVSGYGPETTDVKQDWNAINNAMDNLVNIIQSQTTLHNVALRLYARNMTYGNAEQDNNYILAHNYRAELNHTPKEVQALIDRTDEEKTYENISAYEVASHDNHIYGLFHWTHRYYSYQALSNIKVRRVSNSDMLEITYENDDPSVVFNTLEILNDEFVKQYRTLRFGETNNVIAFFEGELLRVGSELRNQEDSLRDYSIDNQVINYEEQTKHIAALSRDFELQYEAINLSYNSAEQLRQTIEAQIDGLQTFRNNAAFIERLHNISDLQSHITAVEAFSKENNGADDTTLKSENIDRLRADLANETDSLRRLTSMISNQKYTKEGISSNSLVQQWLDAVLLSAKSKAELSIMDSWRKSLDDRYTQYAPVGSTLKRKKRLISFTEQSYLSMLQALNSARLRQKNLQMSSATLKIINPPILPISAEPTKRKLMVAASFFAVFCFVLGFFILLELLDRTLRDKIRAERITGGRVIGAFPAVGKLGQRRFVQQYREIAAKSLSNAIFNYFNPDRKPKIINLLSTESGDGKTMLSQHLAESFRAMNMRVRVISWNKDFAADQRDYLLSTTPEAFVRDVPGEVAFAEADIVIMEYPPLCQSSIPTGLLSCASLNLLVIPANRTWKETDQILYKKATVLADQAPTAICLNQAGRDVVEIFTGLLPPYTRMRRLGYQISQFGFTAVK